MCGFMFTTEKTFKKHTEEIHGQKYTIQRIDSITKSPPNKKVKGHHDESMDFESLDIIKQKDGKITELELKINQLEMKIKVTEENNHCVGKTTDPVPSSENTPPIGPIPNHLTPVQDHHLHDLQGIRMKADGNP